MERRIKIYKTPEEREVFYRAFLERLYIQEFLARASIEQQRKIQYNRLPKNKKIITRTSDFSAS